MLPRRCFLTVGLVSHHNGIPDIFPRCTFLMVLPNQVLLTGTQRFTLMGNVSESLAGRDDIVNLKSLLLPDHAALPQTGIETNFVSGGSSWCPRRGLYCAHYTVVTTVEGTHQVISQGPEATFVPSLIMK